ncbi:MAG: VOC family protein, partial [Chitinophagaceae bacterium]
MSTSKKIPTSLLPFLVVSSCAKAIAFYQASFNARIEEQHDMHGGKLMARLSIDHHGFWVGDEEEEFDNISPLLFKGTAVRMILVTQNPQSFFDRAVAAGAVQICPMTHEEAW